MYNLEKYKFDGQHLEKDVQFNILLDIDKCKLSFISEGIAFEYLLKGFTSNLLAKTITVEWVENTKDDQGILINSKPKIEMIFDAEFIELFNTYASFPFFHIKHCLNIVSKKEIKYVLFNKVGEFSPVSI
jgi:hypothetical protein